jgi:AraC-like DNA-binding protein
VLTLVATGAFLRLYDGGAAPIPRMVENLALLVSSTLLLLAALEPLTSLDRGMARAERVFRIGFAAGYVTVLAIAVIWVNGAPAGSGAERFGPAIKGACAVIALLGMGFAVWYRGRHPLPASPAATGRSRRPPQAEDTGGLAERLLRLMTIEAIYTRPSLKVADLARAVAEAEYKVSRCITGPLGFRNFNHMANHFRIEEAKQRLSDPARDHLPILTVAYDCGFGSIGPFNRTFKAQTGVTPQQFRQARQAGKPAAGQPPGAAGPALDI